jgi:hypothetical protein
MSLTFFLAVFSIAPALVAGLVPSNLTECLSVPNCTVANNPLYGVRNGTAMPPCLVKEVLGGWSCFNAMDDTGECPAFATMDCRVLWSPTHIVNAIPPMPVCRSKCDIAGEADEPFVVGISPGVAPPCWYPYSSVQQPNQSASIQQPKQAFACFAKLRGKCPFPRAGWDCEKNELIGVWTYPNL